MSKHISIACLQFMLVLFNTDAGYCTLFSLTLLKWTPIIQNAAWKAHC